MNHVLRHTVDDPDRKLHGVFSGPRHPFEVVDDAYVRGQADVPGVFRQPTILTKNGPRDGTITNMGEEIGFVGGSHGAAARHPTSQHLQLVVENGNEVITSYPVAGIPG